MNKKNDYVIIRGKIVSDFIYKFCINNEKFYETKVEAMRLSNVADIVPVVISEKIFDISKNQIGKTICVEGYYKSNDLHKNGHSFLELYVLAEKINIFEKDESFEKNIIILNGFFCKKPIYRETPLGRKITDVMLAVNRKGEKPSYIPCIFRGKNADIFSEFEVGTHVKIWGRIQSRKYMKKINETEMEERIAYEVSVSKFKI